MIDRFRCEQEELLNIYTGCIADFEDLVCAREKGSKALAAAKNDRRGEKMTPVRLSSQLQRRQGRRCLWLSKRNIYMKKRVQLLEMYILCKT